jgi:hypothetical protein
VRQLSKSASIARSGCGAEAALAGFRRAVEIAPAGYGS